MSDDAAVFSRNVEGGVRRIVGRAIVGLARFVPACRDMGGAKAGHRFHRSEKVVQDVAPVAEHVDDDAAALFLAVIPRRALDGHRVTLEYSIAELAADAEDA